MKMTPYLMFNNQCKAAFTFYEQLFNGKITFMMTHGDSPVANEVSNVWHDAILHAHMTIGDLELMASDACGEYVAPQGIYVALKIDDIAEAERIYNSLSEGGVINMALAETFWAERFAMFTDRFGTPWMINCGDK